MWAQFTANLTQGLETAVAAAAAIQPSTQSGPTIMGGSSNYDDGVKNYNKFQLAVIKAFPSPIRFPTSNQSGHCSNSRKTWTPTKIMFKNEWCGGPKHSNLRCLSIVGYSLHRHPCMTSLHCSSTLVIPPPTLPQWSMESPSSCAAIGPLNSRHYCNKKKLLKEERQKLHCLLQTQNDLTNRWSLPCAWKHTMNCIDALALSVHYCIHCLDSDLLWAMTRIKHQTEETSSHRCFQQVIWAIVEDGHNYFL